MAKILVAACIAQAEAHGYLSIPAAAHRECQPSGTCPISQKEFADRSTMYYTSPTHCPNANGGAPAHCPGQAVTVSPCGHDIGLDNSWKNDGRSRLNAFGGPGKVYKWKAGSEQEVAWTYNDCHGGYMSYSLCPAESMGKETNVDGPTEKCFRDGLLEFVSNETRWVCDKSNPWKPCPTDKSDPLKRCGCRTGKTFQSQMKGKYWKEDCLWNGQEGPFEDPGQGVASRVKIPANLNSGKYVLRWRWDALRTDQVWLNCVDIEITGSTPSPSPSPRPTPSPQPTPAPSPSPGSCTYLADTMTESYTGKEVSPSKEECCKRCAQKVGCESVVFQNNKCKWADKGSPHKPVTGAFLAVLGKDEEQSKVLV